MYQNIIKYHIKNTNQFYQKKVTRKDQDKRKTRKRRQRRMFEDGADPGILSFRWGEGGCGIMQKRKGGGVGGRVCIMQKRRGGLCRNIILKGPYIKKYIWLSKYLGSFFKAVGGTTMEKMRGFVFQRNCRAICIGSLHQNPRSTTQIK